jgi:hypothetical protein
MMSAEGSAARISRRRRASLHAASIRQASVSRVPPDFAFEDVAHLVVAVRGDAHGVHPGDRHTARDGYVRGEVRLRHDRDPSVAEVLQSVCGESPQRVLVLDLLQHEHIGAAGHGLTDRLGNRVDTKSEALGIPLAPAGVVVGELRAVVHVVEEVLDVPAEYREAG